MKKNIQSYSKLGIKVLFLKNEANAHKNKQLIDDMPIGKFKFTSLIIPDRKIKPKPNISGFFKTQKKINM